MIDSHRDEIAKLESLYAMNPEGRVFTHLAEAYRKAGELERARGILQDGLRKHPDYASAHVVLGRVLADSGEEDAAVKEFRRVLELDRHNLIALRSLGDLAEAGGRIDEAVHYYSELAVLDPTDSAIQDRLHALRGGLESASEPGEGAGEPEPEAAVAGSGNGGGESSAAPGIEEEAAEEIEAPAGFEATGLAPSTGDAPEAGEALTAGAGGWAELSVEEERLDEEAIEGVSEPVGEDGAGILMEAWSIELEVGDEEAGEVTEIEVDQVVIETAGVFEDIPASDVESIEAAEEEAELEAVAGEEPGVEGRWDEPATLPADLEAELSRGTVGSGEWIPADRWEWVSASAGEPVEESEPEAEAEEVEEIEPEEIAEPEWLVEADAESAETEAEEEDLEIRAEPVESFEAGASAVLEVAFGEPATEDTGEEVELTFGAELEGIDLEPAETVAGEAVEAGDWLAGEDDSGEQVITETLAEIYASQGLMDRAASVYRRLVRQHPGDERLAARLDEIERAAEWAESDEAPAEPAATVDAGDERDAWLARVESAWTGGEGAAAIEDSPYAWPAETPGAAEDGEGERVGEYFRALLSWQPESMTAGGPQAELPEIEAVETDLGDWPAAEEEAEEGGAGAAREGEEDLEMFRSWLKSLKK